MISYGNKAAGAPTVISGRVLGQEGDGASGDKEAGDFHGVSGSWRARTVKEVPFGRRTGDGKKDITGEEDMPLEDGEHKDVPPGSMSLGKTDT